LAGEQIAENPALAVSLLPRNPVTCTPNNPNCLSPNALPRLDRSFPVNFRVLRGTIGIERLSMTQNSPVPVQGSTTPPYLRYFLGAKQGTQKHEIHHNEPKSHFRTLIRSSPLRPTRDQLILRIIRACRSFFSWFEKLRVSSASQRLCVKFALQPSPKGLVTSTSGRIVPYSIHSQRLI